MENVQPDPAEREPRRTFTLEVLTPELRASRDGTAETLLGRVPADAVVGVVQRLDGALDAVLEVDTDWCSTWSNQRPDVLARLLRQASLYASGYPSAEVLMPGVEVLAALEGRPVGGYTGPTASDWGCVKTGWFVRAEIDLPTGADVAWLLVEDATDCPDPASCAIAGGEGSICRVVTIRGRGVRHVARWYPVMVRIPATTEVEPR
jgi:hypothetical protein